MKWFCAVSLITSVVAGSVGFFVKYLAAKGGPVLYVERRIDFGLLDPGKIAETSLAIRNRGGAQLVLDEFGRTCGCIEVGRKSDNGLQPVEMVVVNPGDEELLWAGIRIKGKVGQPLREFIRFRTNDPNNSDVSIEMVARVNGSVLAVPDEINFGRVLVGQTLSCTFEIRDTGIHPGTSVERVVSSVPDALRIARRMTALPQAGGGDCLCVLEAILQAPAMPGTFNADLTVKCTGKENSRPLTIPVSAIVVPKFELLPASLLLPRISGAGPIYQGHCICRSWTGKPLHLKSSTVPQGLKVSIEQSDGNKEQACITVRASSRGIPYRGTDKVVLYASDGEAEAALTLPVSLWNP